MSYHSRVENELKVLHQSHRKPRSDSAFTGFEFGFVPQNYTNVNETTSATRNSAPPQFTCFMAGRQDPAQLPAGPPSILASPSVHVKPLYLRKASSHAHLIQNKTTDLPLTNHDSHQSNPEKSLHPPRSTSIRHHPSYCGPPITPPDTSRINAPSPMKADSSFNPSDSPGQASTAVCSIASDTNPPTISSNKSRYLYPTVLNNSSRYHSSEIMGDFVPIDSPNMAGLQPNLDHNDDNVQGTFKPFKKPKINPYEFEPSTPLYDITRQTTFTDFSKKGQDPHAILSARSAHIKNARSEENAVRVAQVPNNLTVTPTKSIGPSLQRSESSPNISQVPFSPQRHETPSSDHLRYYSGNREGDLSARSDYGVYQGIGNHATQNAGSMFASRSVGRGPPDMADDYRSRSPIRHSLRGSSNKGYTINRSMSRSPTKHLEGVSERHESIDNLPKQFSDNSPVISPPKRSRSPMKKMFGENGWLGKSPDETPDLKPSKKPFITSTDFANRPKKVGMMEKLKNKFDEIAEKADLSPMGRARSNSDKQKQAVLAVSLGPPEQARVYMEVELMLVHTANSFLMNQFSQGRMDIDSIKKTVESWRNKGRPTVIEFMYDQATQRDLVLANQHSFRFHGSNAGSDIRINSMLYNWKQVANIMLIRTFCNADTVILKLLFDIEQILELLGAVEPMMIRLQQIRATATEIMRISCQRKESKASSRSFGGRESSRNSDSSAANSHYSTNDPYGGMKLVPDNYEG